MNGSTTSVDAGAGVGIDARELSRDEVSSGSGRLGSPETATPPRPRKGSRSNVALLGCTTAAAARVPMNGSRSSVDVAVPTTVDSREGALARPCHCGPRSSGWASAAGPTSIAPSRSRVEQNIVLRDLCNHDATWMRVQPRPGGSGALDDRRSTGAACDVAKCIGAHRLRVWAPCYVARVGARLAVVLAVVVGSSVPTLGWARDHTPQVVPPKYKRGKRPPPPADLSLGGTRRGGIELALGSITALITGVLIGRGVWEVVTAARVKRRCAGEIAVDDPECGVLLKPGRAGQIAAGLTFGFAVPMAIASGFLFRRGIRMRRDYRRFVAQQHAVAFSPWGDRTGGGVSLRLRF
jgi:hypothetical protein